MARSAQMQSISCAQCGVLCTSRPALIQHNLEQHPIPQEKKDDITQRVQPAAFKALVSRIHSNIIQNQPEQQLSPKNNEMPNAVEAFLQCNHPNCNQFFSEKLELDHHLEIHRKMMHKCTHQNCSRTFNDEKNLKSHLKAHEEQEKEWECAPCSKTFPSKESLRAHSKIHTPCHALKLKKNILQNEESIRIMWKCTHPECTKEFLNKRGLGQHMKNHKLKHH